VQPNNQDSFGRDDSCGLSLICDGIGGAAGGELASSLAAETFLAVARQELKLINDNANSTALAMQRSAATAARAVVVRANWDTRLRELETILVGFARFWTYQFLGCNWHQYGEPFDAMGNPLMLST
jgi:serine/threonine protein phosphatase PrpC